MGKRKSQIGRRKSEIYKGEIVVEAVMVLNAVKPS